MYGEDQPKISVDSNSLESRDGYGYYAEVGNVNDRNFLGKMYTLTRLKNNHRQWEAPLHPAFPIHNAIHIMIIIS